MSSRQIEPPAEVLPINQIRLNIYLKRPHRRFREEILTAPQIAAAPARLHVVITRQQSHEIEQSLPRFSKRFE